MACAATGPDRSRTGIGRGHLSVRPLSLERVGLGQIGHLAAAQSECAMAFWDLYARARGARVTDTAERDNAFF
jgi:hypothetical protein